MYLHIGTFKTGTSSLQHFLHDHRDWLQQHDCLVPGSNPQDHHSLARSIIRKFSNFAPPGWPSDDNYEKLWNRFHDEVQRSACHSVLLSSEYFCDFAHESHRQKTGTMIRWLAQQLEDFDVRIICYLRPLHAYAKSLYKHEIKGSNNSRTLMQQLDQHVAQRSIHVAPTAYLDFYAAQFGAGNLLLRQYDRNTLVNGSTIDDFVGLIGLPPRVKRHSYGKLNTSLPDDLIDIKRTFNETTYSSIPETRRVGEALVRASAPALGRPSQGWRTIKETLQQEHEALAERYGLDLGEVEDPFLSTYEGSVEARGTEVLISMLWEEVRELRARVDELAPGSGPDRKRPKRYRHFARRLLNRVGNSKE